MLVAIVPVLVAIVGVLMFALSSNAKLSKIGFALFWCGVLVALFVAARHTVAVP
jgi:hypothetical protein